MSAVSFHLRDPSNGDPSILFYGLDVVPRVGEYVRLDERPSHEWVVDEVFYLINERGQTSVVVNLIPGMKR